MTTVDRSGELATVVPDPHTAYEHFSVQLRDDHAAIHAELRDRCPLRSEAHDGHWVLLTHDHVNQAARRPEALSSRIVNLPQPDGVPVLPPLNYDPPEHQKYRSLLAADFSPGRIASFRERIRAEAVDLMNEFVERGEADLAAEFVFPLTARATSLFLGIEKEDVPEFQQRAMDLVTELFRDPEGYPDLIGATVAFFLGHIARRRECPADDLASHLLHAIVDGRVISDEVSAMIHLVLNGAAGETTAAGGTNMFLILEDRRDLRERLIADPALYPKAVDELIRYISPIPGFRRDAVTDVTIGGTTIRAGEKVWLSFLSANYDPAAFERPDEIVLDRTPNRHLAFGSGIHRCPGAPLARLEMEIMLEQVLGRIPDYRVTDRAAAALKPSATRLRSHLPIAFTPRSPPVSTTTNPASGPVAAAPPGFPPMPNAEELALFMERPLDALPRFFAKYGDPITLPSQMGPMVVTAHPATAEVILKNHLSRGPLHQRTEPAQGRGITIQAGAEWRRARSMINPAFTHSRLRALSDLVAEGAAYGLAGLERYADSGEPVDLQAFLPNVTLGVLVHAMFSDSLSDAEMAAFIDDFGLLSRWKGGLQRTAFAPPGTPVPFEEEGRAAKTRTDDVINGIITERRAHPGERSDLLALLLETRDENDGSGLSDEEVRNHMTTLFMGGFDTTAFGLTWTVAAALLSPRGLAPLREVADRVQGRLPAGDDLANLAYLKAAFDEGVRLQGHPLLPRQLAYDDDVGGYRLPEGTMVIISSWVMHRRPDLWDQPNDFRPERYLGEENQGRNRWQSLAFGGGPRFCIGVNFAYLEATFVLALLLSRYDLALVPGWELRPTYVFNVILDGGLPVTLRRR